MRTLGFTLAALVVVVVAVLLIGILMQARRILRLAGAANGLVGAGVFHAVSASYDGHSRSQTRVHAGEEGRGAVASAGADEDDLV